MPGKATVLVVGGAGYIGAHAVKQLASSGYDVVTLDNLAHGHREAVRAGVFEQGDMGDSTFVKDVFRRHRIDAVMHFAAYAYVGESVTDPRKYYRNNVSNTVSMLDAMHATGIRKLVFSSTCATYGMPPRMPITEDLPQNQSNPYGDSKLMVEHILKDTAKAEGLAFAAPRYFNVAGCAPDGSIGEDHRPETHIIPVLLNVVLGKKSHMDLFGTDYPTKDGTCVRDYIHVWDLVEAHLVLMENLKEGQGLFYNLGVGRGYSDREIIDAVERVTGKKILVKEAPRRPGDPPELYAAPTKIKNELGWSARFTDLDEIVRTAWNWFSKQPNGYD